MLAVYRAGGSLAGLPTPRPYRDYIVWLTQQDRAAAIARWTEYLRGVSGPLMVADGTVAAGDGVPVKTRTAAGRRRYGTAARLGGPQRPHAQYRGAVRLGRRARQALRPSRCRFRHHRLRPSRKRARRGDAWSDCSSTRAGRASGEPHRLGGRTMRAVAARVVGDARHRLSQPVGNPARTWPRNAVRQPCSSSRTRRSRTPSVPSPHPMAPASVRSRWKA